MCLPIKLSKTPAAPKEWSRGSLETSLQLPLDHSFGAAGVFDNLIGKHIAKLHARGKWRILCFRLHGKIAIDLAVCGVRRNLGKLQHVRLVAQLVVQLFQKKVVPQRNSRHLGVAVKRQRAADVGTKIHAIKAREQRASLIEKTEIAIFNTHASNFRSHCQSWFLAR